MDIPIDEQIKEVGREIGLRRGYYARQVSEGKMKPKDAEYKIQVMMAVRETLIQLRDTGEFKLV